MACPAQWDAWDADGNYYYLRFRHGFGTVTQYTDEDWVGAPVKEGISEDEQYRHSSNSKFIREVAEFDLGDDEFGAETLTKFAGYAGLELDDSVYVTSFGDHIRDEMIKDGMTFFLEGEQ